MADAPEAVKRRGHRVRTGPRISLRTTFRERTMAKKSASKRAEKRPSYRLKEISDEQMSALQRALRDAIYSGPCGIRKKLTGPFQIWLNPPELGHLAQALGGHVR